MSKLLFIGLGSGETKRYVVTSLLEQGYELVVLAERTPAWIKPYAAHSETADLTDLATATKQATSLGRACAVDGVLACDEAYVELSADVARRLGLPGLTTDAAALCRDKHAMRRRLAEAGIPSARSIMVGTPAQARQAADSIGYPVVLKPRNLGGSIGVVRADDPADVFRLFEVATGAAMARISALSGVLVEEYLDGPEFSVESVTFAGVTTICGITEKILGFAPFFEEVGHFARPFDPSNALDAQLMAIVLDVHKALGITLGAAHCEVRMTADGPRIIEIAGRLAGDRIPYITKLASGVDLLAAAAAAATGKQVDVKPTADRVAGIRMVYPDRDGVIVRRQMKTGVASPLEDMGWYVKVGQRVALPPRGFLSRLAYLVAVGNTKNEVNRRLDEGESMLEIDIEQPDPVDADPGEPQEQGHRPPLSAAAQFRRSGGLHE